MYAFLLATALVASCPHGCQCQPPTVSKELVFDKPAAQVLVEVLENEPDLFEKLDTDAIFENAKLSVAEDFSEIGISTTAGRRFSMPVGRVCLNFRANEKLVFRVKTKTALEGVLSEDGEKWARTIDRLLPKKMIGEFAKSVDDLGLKQLLEIANSKRDGQVNAENLRFLIDTFGVMDLLKEREVAVKVSRSVLDYNLRVTGPYVNMMAVHIQMHAEGEKTRVKIRVWCRLRGFIVRRYSHYAACQTMAETERIIRSVVEKGKIPEGIVISP